MFCKIIFGIVILSVGTKGISFTPKNSYECKLGPNTPYRCVANYDDSQLKYSDCVEKKIWLILRHGTRFPGKKYVRRMIDDLPQWQSMILNNYEDGKTNLSRDDIALFKNWVPSLTQNDIMKLTVEGENEMIDLGERYQARFPSLMPEIYDNRTYKFKYTSTQRTQESAKHFAAGLFGWYNSRNVLYPEPIYRDPVLRFYKACPRWRQEVDKNPHANIEVVKFLESKIMRDVLDNIKNLIGHSIDYDSAYLMYNMCAYETAWNESTVSPWCKIFSFNDFRVFEYAADLEYYWIDGYGHKLTYEQACPALKDVFDFLKSKEDLLATIYFTHSGTILKLLALLGIAKDTHPLMHDSYVLYEEDKRAWRTSIIDTFASNFAFILYDCPDEGPSILFMFQERPLYLPGCPENMPCPIRTMEALYPDEDEECQFNAMCRITKNV